MAIRIKKTGNLNIFTIELTGEDQANNPHEAQIVFDALDTMLVDNEKKVRTEIKLMKDGSF